MNTSALETTMAVTSEATASVNKPFTLGLFAGYLLLMAVIIVAVLIMRKRCKQDQFDERQLLARNAAYKTSFFAVMIYMIVCLFASVLEIEWAVTEIKMYIGIAIGVGAFVFVCLIKDAYFGYNKDSNPRFLIILSYIIAAANWFAAIMQLVGGDAFITNNMLNESCGNLVMAILFTFVAIACTVKGISIRKAEDE